MRRKTLTMGTPNFGRFAGGFMRLGLGRDVASRIACLAVLPLLVALAGCGDNTPAQTTDGGIDTGADVKPDGGDAGDGALDGALDAGDATDATDATDARDTGVDATDARDTGTDATDARDAGTDATDAGGGADASDGGGVDSGPD